MDLTERRVTLKWNIEQKPDGGYIAKSENPADTIEGATREEVETKMREKVAELVGPEIAAKLQLNQLGSHLETHVEKKISFSLNKSGQSTPSLTPQLGAPVPAPIDAGSSGSLLASVWKALVLVGIAVIIWLLLRR